MNFSTTSYLAGVGSVVAALTVGFSGGFFMATPPGYVEPNRLQRVTASAPPSNPAPQTVAAARPETTAAPKPETTEASVTSAPPRAVEPPARPEAAPVIAKATEPEQAPVIAKTAEPVRPEVVKERDTQPSVNAVRLRAAEARAAERKQAEARKFAERRKQQREIEQATVVVRRLVRDRDPEQVADGIETPRFGFFGESTDR